MAQNLQFIGDHQSVKHFVSGKELSDLLGSDCEWAVFGMGCFWGVERLFWEVPGVLFTTVGYSGGKAGPTSYKEVCSGFSGHAEVVAVAFDPKLVTFEQLLKVFWENHDPTQGDRQGNDVGSQYRSAIYVTKPNQLESANTSRDTYQSSLKAAGEDTITTEIRDLREFYLAEPEHQQYLAKNPAGYCGLKGTGVSCPIGVQA